MLRILSKLDDMRLPLSDDNQRFAESVRNARDPDDGEPFPPLLYRALSSLWDDPNVQDIWRDRDSYDFPERFAITFDSMADKMTRFNAGPACRTSFLHWTDSSISHIHQQTKTY